MVILGVLEIDGVELAGTVAGVLAVLVPALVGLILSKILKAQHIDTKEGQAALEQRVIEAEALIRGDIKNGVKEKLESIDSRIRAQDTTAVKVAAALAAKSALTAAPPDGGGT